MIRAARQGALVTGDGFLAAFQHAHALQLLERRIHRGGGQTRLPGNLHRGGGPVTNRLFNR